MDTSGAIVGGAPLFRPQHQALSNNGALCVLVDRHLQINQK